MTPLDKTLKRSLCIKGIGYVVTLSPEALKLTVKGRRLGVELKWADITSGESALAVALHASVGRFDPGPERKHAKSEAPHSKALQSKALQSKAPHSKAPPKNPDRAKSASARGRRSARGLPTKRSR